MRIPFFFYIHHRSAAIILQMMILGCFGFLQVNAQDAAGKIIADESFTGYKTGDNLDGRNGGSGWKSSWKSNQPGEYIVQPALEYNSLRPGSARLVLTAKSNAQEISRGLADQVAGINGTVWVRVFFKKTSGTGKAGISLLDNGKEKLFIGNTGTAANSATQNVPMVNIGDDNVHLILVRIDLQKGKHTAYVFVDPGIASIPDQEGANASFTGDFRFNKIAFSAMQNVNGSSTVAEFGPVLICGRFEDAVAILKVSVKDERVAAGANLKVISWKKETGRLIITTTGGILQLTPFQAGTLKVQFGTKAAIDSSKSFAVDIRPSAVLFDVRETVADLEMQTKEYRVKILKGSGRIQLMDPSGKLLIEEVPSGGKPAVVNNTVTVADAFRLSETEALFGLGQFRDGFMNLRGRRRELIQFNTQAAVPVLLSTNGWGMFWDNPSRTIFTDTPSGMSFTSDIGDEIRFYLFAGASLDAIVAQYRRLTGEAPMLPRWALGYHQSRNRYSSSAEVLAVCEQMRKEMIPFSSIFIDYYYWGKYGLGSHRFDEASFPDMRSLAKKVHDEYHGKLVATVWPAFKPGTPNYDTMKARGFLLDGVKALDGIIYDAFNPKAAEFYWELVKKDLLNNGIDGWFLDGPEPDNINTYLPAVTYAGPALKVRNVYPLVHSATFYQGLLKKDPDIRPYILTRCAWASQQKNGTAIWSGDIGSSFDELKKQIPAGLNFVATGIPYWTTDIGGYSGGNPEDPAYREVYTRWFQYGAFCPVFRSHGRRFPGDTKGLNELWAYGKSVQEICTNFDMLRYRLMPYIYSLSNDITQKNYTMMRLLAFDFAGDTTVLNIGDQFMFGPSLLVNPVTEAGARQRKVYLPAGTEWINFWTGEKSTGGHTITADAPITELPLFVKAGSIIPFGAAIQYTDERPADTIELRVYRGKDGQFELYEDDGETFGYKKGHSQRIQFNWNEATETLSVRNIINGEFKGRLKQRIFRIVWVKPGNGTGVSPATSGIIIHYSGKPVSTRFKG